MATTALTIIADALLELGVYSSAETPATSDQNLGLDVLNRLIDAWAQERLAVTQNTPITGSLIAGQSALSVQTPDLRPVAWVYGPGQGSVTVGGNTTLISVVSAIEFAVLNATPLSGTPVIAWPDVSALAFQTIVNFAPTPNAPAAVTVNQLTAITSFAATNTSYTLGLGVFDALVHNLAIALKPYFVTGQIAPEIIMLAQETKNFLRYQNRPSRALLARDRKIALPKQAVPGEGAAA